MPRFKYTRIVTEYSFTPPENITESDYNMIKNLLSMNPQVNLGGESEEDKKDDSKMYLLLVIGIICFLIGMLTCLSSDSYNDIPAWAFLMWAGSLFFIIHPIVNGGMLQSSVNKSNAEIVKQAYFDDLKEMIICSSNYKTFSKEYQKKYNKNFFDFENHLNDFYKVRK